MSNERIGAAAIVMIALLVGVVIGAGAAGVGPHPPLEQSHPMDPDPAVRPFQSSDAFASYFADRSPPVMRMRTTGGTDAVAVEGGAGDDGLVRTEQSAGPADRASTNTQERGLDEPDVLKTGEDAVYYSGYAMRRGDAATHILDLEDATDPAVVATIPAQGELLRVEDTLLVLGTERIWGYDVSDPSNPARRWHHPLNASLRSARLHDGEVYLVLAERPEPQAPCPLMPIGDEPVACTDVYRPNTGSNADAIYTAARLDPTGGEIEARASVVGSVHRSATYVSEHAIYLSYTRGMSTYEVMSAYIDGPGSGHLDAETVEHVEWITGLDLTDRAKWYELRATLDAYFASLDADERERVETAFGEGLTAFAAEQKRNLTRTGITRIDLEDMAVSASGEVPGYPLNQWSMDEHDGHLRIATTIPGSWGTESENDIYVLDRTLSITGSVEGLGEDQRIYSVRFDGDEGQVVTFRQIDPFYTLDLSDPHDPQLEGELKVPGVSHYLHPLDDAGDLVLGVGEEDGQVKLSTFDVRDRSDPTELDVAILEGERATEVNRNHRAFLHDPRHEVVFIPGYEHSYVFSYAEGKLVEEVRVDIGGPGVRATYIGDHLYVLGAGEVVVLDETTWEERDRIDLP